MRKLHSTPANSAPSTRRAIRRILTGSIAAAAALAAQSSPAATIAGTGWTGVTDGLWSTNTNWDSIPPSADERNLFFGQGYRFAGGLGATTANNDLVGYSGYRITFQDSDAAGTGTDGSAANDTAFTITGNGFTLFDFGGGNFPRIENQSYLTQTFNLSAGQTIVLNGGVNTFAEINPVNGNLFFSATTGIDLAGTTQLRVNGNNGNSATVEGVVSSSGNGGLNTIAINQNSLLFLKGANTYNGDTFVNAGELRLGNSTQGTGAVRLGDTLGTANAAYSLTNNAITGAGLAITKALEVRSGSSGVKTLGNSGVASNTISGAITLNNPLTIAPSAGSQLRLTGVISGTNQAITVNGSGMTVFGGVNNFTGQVTVKSGATLGLIPATVTLGTSSTLGNTGVGNETIVESGGTLNVGGSQFGNQLPAAANNEIFRIAGSGVGGVGALISTLTTGNNTLSKVVLTGNASISAGGNNQVSYGSGGNIITGNGRTDIRQSALPTLGQAHLDLAGNTLTVSGNHLLALVNSDVSDGNIIVNAGQLNIEGGTLIQGGSGTITVNSGGRLGFWSVPAAGNITRQIIVNGGTVGDPTSTGAAQTIGAPIQFTGAGNPNFVSINTTLATTLSGLITQSGFTGTSLDKRGTGILAFSNIANSFSAPISIYAGTLRADYSTTMTGGVAPASVTTTDTPLGTGNVITLAGGTLALRANMDNTNSNQRWSLPSLVLTLDRAPNSMSFDRIANAAQTDKIVVPGSIVITGRNAANGWSIGQNQFTFSQLNTHRLEFANLTLGNDTVLNTGDFIINGTVTSAGRNSIQKIGGSSWGIVGDGGVGGQQYNAAFITGNTQTRVGSMFGTPTVSSSVTLGSGPIFNGPNNAITFRGTGNINNPAGQIVEIKSQMQTQSTIQLETDFISVPASLRAIGGGVLGVGNNAGMGAIDFAMIGDGTFRVGAGFGGQGAGTITGVMSPGAGGVVRTGGGNTVTFSATNAIGGAAALEVGSDLMNGGFRTSFNGQAQSGTTVLTQSNNYTGGTTINRSSVLVAQGATPVGTGAVNVFGTFTLSGAGTLTSGATNTNTVNLNPGSILRFDNNASPATNLNRWGDTVAIPLNSTAVQLVGFNGGTTETVGNISVSGNSGISVVRTTAGNTILAGGTLTRINSGVLALTSSGAGTLGGVDRFTVSNAVDFQVGGSQVISGDVVRPWIVNTTDNAYVTYGVNGFANKAFNIAFSAAGVAPAWAVTDVVNVTAAPTNVLSQDILGLKTSVLLAPTTSNGGAGAALQGVANGASINIRSGGFFHTGAAGTVVGPAIKFATAAAGTAVEGFFYNPNTIDLGTLQVTSTTVTSFTTMSTDGVITAGAGFVKAGAGSLRINSVQNITGGVTIQNGNIELRNPTTSAAVSPLGTNTITFAGTANGASPSLSLRNTVAQTWNNPVILAAGLPLATIDASNSGNGTATNALPSLTMNGAPGAQGQTLTISGANALTINAAAATPALTLATGGNFTINNAITTQLSSSTFQGIAFNAGSPTNLTKAGAGNLILANTVVTNPAVGSKVIVNAGTLELRSVTSLGTAATTTLEMNAGTLNLRRDSSAVYGGPGGAGAGYNVNVNGNSTISVDRVSANSNLLFTLGAATIKNDATLTANSGNGIGLGLDSLRMAGTGFLVSNIGPGSADTGAVRVTGAVTGGSLVKLGGQHLHLLGTSTFDGGLFANAGTVRLRGAGAAGTGTVVVNPGATLDFNAANNLNVGQAVIVNSTPAALAMISMNADLAHPTVGVDTTNATVGIVGLSNSPTGIYNTPINMGALYGGRWSLGGVSAGAYDPRYTATSLGVGADNLYRLGGGGTSFFLGFDAVTSLGQNNVLTGGGNSARFGFDSGNIYTGTSGSPGNFQFVLGGSNDYDGSTVIHRGIAVRSLAAVSGFNSAFGSNAVNVFGSLVLSANGTLVDGGGNATNPLTLHPGSSLVLDNNNTAQSVLVANLTDRIANTQAINLKGSLIDFLGNNNNPSTETLGTVTIGGSSRIRAARNGTGTTTLTITNLAGTTTAGNSLLLQTSAAAQLGLPAGDRIIASNLGTVAMVDPRVVNITDGQFVGHDAVNGFVNITGSTNITGAAANLPAGLAASVNLNIAATGTQTLSDNMTINSLRTDRDVNNGGPFNKITLRSGGLLAATNALTIQPDLVFHDGTNPIEARITAITNILIQGQLTANGITKAGPGQLFIRVPQPNYASGWTINSGDIIFDDPQGAGQSVPGNTITLNGSTSTGGVTTGAGFGGLLGTNNVGNNTRAVFRFDNQSPETVTFTGGPINVWNDATIQAVYANTAGAAANDRNGKIPAISLNSSSSIASAGLNIDIPNSRNRTVTPSLTLNSDGTLRIVDGGSTGDYGRVQSFAVDALVGALRNLLKIGNRTLELTGDNTASFTGGGINIGQGTVLVRHDGALGSASTAVTIERNATLEIGKSNYSPGNTSFTQKAGSSERWDLEDARGLSYNLPAGVNLQLNTNLLTARTVGLNGGTIEGFVYTDGLANAVLRTVEAPVTINLLSNSFLGQNILQGATYDTGLTPLTGQPFGDNYRGASLDIRGAITGSFDLEKTGLDTVQISGTSNTFNNTTASMGVLRIGATNALPISGALITRLGGTFDLYGFNQTVGALGTGLGYTRGGVSIGSSGRIVNSGAVDLKTVTVNQATDTSYNGSIEQNVSLTKTGAGVLTLGNPDNSYRGVTTVAGGTLAIGKIVNGSTVGNTLTSSIGQSSSAAGNLVFSGGGLLRYTGGTTSTDRQFTLGDGGGGFESSGAGPLTLSSTAAVAHTGVGARDLALTGTNTGLNVFAGSLGDGAAASSLTKTGTGLWVLNGSNTHTGPTTVSNGTLRLNRIAADNTTIATDGNIATTSDIVINGGNLEMTRSEQIGDSGSITMSSGSLGFGGVSGLTETIDKLTVTGGTFTSGANTLLVGGATITWAGGTNTVSTGGLVSDKHWIITGGTNTVQTNGLLRVQSGTGTVGLFFGGTASPTITLDSHATDSGEILLKQDVTVDNTLTAGTAQILSGGVAAVPGSIDMNGGTRIWSVNNGSVAVDMLVSASITNGALTKADTGTLKFTGNNTFTGTTTINAGTLEAGAAGALGGTANIVANTGGTLLLSGAGSLDRVNDAAGVTLAGGTLAVVSGSREGTAAIVTAGVPAGTSMSGLGLLTLSANSTLDFDSLGNGTLLSFAGFSPGAFTLNITNWTNTTFDATLNSGVAADDRLVFNSDQSGNLSRFDFGFGPGVGVSQIALDAGFYEVGIAPVPEPSSIATVMGLLGLVGWRERRKARQARAAERRAV